MGLIQAEGPVDNIRMKRWACEIVGHFFTVLASVALSLGRHQGLRLYTMQASYTTTSGHRQSFFA